MDLHAVVPLVKVGPPLTPLTSRMSSRSCAQQRVSHSFQDLLDARQRDRSKLDQRCLREVATLEREAIAAHGGVKNIFVIE